MDEGASALGNHALCGQKLSQFDSGARVPAQSMRMLTLCAGRKNHGRWTALWRSCGHSYV